MSSDVPQQNIYLYGKMRRKRGPVFTMEDKYILVDIVQKYSHIIENKKTDNETMNSKNYCWEKQITEEYNSGASTPRSTDVLKNCWKNLKAEGRKVAADESQERIESGGGPNKYVAVDPIMFRVIDLICPTSEGQNRRRPVISQVKNADLVPKRVENPTTVMSHAEKEHQIIMEIHREKLRQERIRTRLLLLELKEAKRKFKS